jgi:hypothetical protein
MAPTRRELACALLILRQLDEGERHVPALEPLEAARRALGILVAVKR